MDANNKETIKRLSRADTICVTCGSTKFEVMRTVPDQIALICEGCGTSSMLNVDNLDGTPVITFMTEEDL